MNTTTFSNTPIDIVQFPDTLEKHAIKSFTKSIKPILNKKQQRLIINLSNLKNLDWQGATYLLSLWKKIAKKQGTLIIAQASPEVQAYMELIQLQRVVEVVSDEGTARSIMA